MAGTPQKMLEHLLETRLEGRAGFGGRDEPQAHDPFLDDFLLTHIIFMPTHQLIVELAKHYRMESPNEDQEFMLACKRRVVAFVYRWVSAIRQPVFDDQMAVDFVEVSNFQTLDPYSHSNCSTISAFIIKIVIHIFFTACSSKLISNWLIFSKVDIN